MPFFLFLGQVLFYIPSVLSPATLPPSLPLSLSLVLIIIVIIIAAK